MDSNISAELEAKFVDALEEIVLYDFKVIMLKKTKLEMTNAIEYCIKKIQFQQKCLEIMNEIYADIVTNEVNSSAETLTKEKTEETKL